MDNCIKMDPGDFHNQFHSFVISDSSESDKQVFRYFVHLERLAGVTITGLYFSPGLDELSMHFEYAGYEFVIEMDEGELLVLRNRQKTPVDIFQAIENYLTNLEPVTHEQLELAATRYRNMAKPADKTNKSTSKVSEARSDSGKGGKMGNLSLRMQLLIIAVLIFVTVVASYWLFRYVPYVADVAKNAHPDRIYLSLMIIVVALVTYFGFLMLPSGFKESSGFTESRIRLAIASTLLITYLVYWGTIIFWTKGAKDDSIDMEIFKTLTEFLKIVLPFYFGATAVTEVMQRTKNKGNKGQDDKSDKD